MSLKVSIIIPVFNGEKTLIALTDRIFKSLADNEVSILFVDDASSDKSRDAINWLQQEYKGIRSIFLPENQGQQQALLRGLREISSDSNYLVTMDDDLQNPPELLAQLLEEIKIGRDLVYASPDKPGENWIRRLGSHMRDLLFHYFLRKPKGVAISSYRIMTRELGEKIVQSVEENREKTFFYFSAVAFRCTQCVSHIQYPYTPRRHGRSSYSLKKLGILYGHIVWHYVIRRKK